MQVCEETFLNQSAYYFDMPFFGRDGKSLDVMRNVRGLFESVKGLPVGNGIRMHCTSSSSLKSCL